MVENNFSKKFQLPTMKSCDLKRNGCILKMLLYSNDALYLYLILAFSRLFLRNELFYYYELYIIISLENYHLY